jgi:hypothetical protein
MKTYILVISCGFCLLALGLTQTSSFHPFISFSEALQGRDRSLVHSAESQEINLGDLEPFEEAELESFVGELCALIPGGFVSHNALLVEEGVGQITLFADLISDTEEKEKGGCAGYYLPESWATGAVTPISIGSNLVEA